jgi:hypothetical protein
MRTRPHLDLYTFKVWHLGCEPTDLVDGTRWHFVLCDNAVGDGDPVIIFTESRRLVDDTGTRGSLDVWVADHSESLVLELRSRETG